MSGTGVVSYVYTDWTGAYPELAATVTAVQGGAYFARAALIQGNTPLSRPTDLVQRTALLYLLTAHIAVLTARMAAGGLVGRISGATEGSVSVSTEMPMMPRGAAFFTQTPYGFEWWQATAAFRTARYIPPPAPYLGTGSGYRGGQ